MSKVDSKVYSLEEIDEIEKNFKENINEFKAVNFKPKSKTISFVLSGQALEMLESAMNTTGLKSGKQAKEFLIDRLYQEKYVNHGH